MFSTLPNELFTTQFTLNTQKFSTRMETSNTSETNAKAMMKHD